MRRIRNSEERKKTSILERLFTCSSKLVREVDTIWNHLVPSLYLMHEKLANLGMVMIADEVTYISREEVRNVWA